jgi:hypothetical protein
MTASVIDLHALRLCSEISSVVQAYHDEDPGTKGAPQWISVRLFSTTGG